MEPITIIACVAAFGAGAVLTAMAAPSLPEAPSRPPTAPQLPRSPYNPNGILPRSVRLRQREGVPHDSGTWSRDYDRVMRLQKLAALGAVLGDEAFSADDLAAGKVSLYVDLSPGRRLFRKGISINRRNDIDVSSETWDLLRQVAEYDDGMRFDAIHREMLHFEEEQEGSATLRAALRMQRADLASRAADALRDVLISVADEEVANKAYLRTIRRCNEVRTAIGAIPLGLDWRRTDAGEQASVMSLGSISIQPRGARHVASVFGATIPATFESAHAAKAAAEGEVRRIAQLTLANLGDGAPRAAAPAAEAA